MPAAPLVTVVGFDGSDASRQALEAAAQLLGGRDGHLEVVYVAHLPSTAGFSAEAEVGIEQGFDVIAGDLDSDVQKALDGRESRWHFQRRDGAVTHELVAAADELRSQYGAAATIVIIVGNSVHLYHHVLGSVPVALAREAKYPLLVVPVSTPAEP
jgi:nucleotide-binding universal stress UspA family protein